MPETSPMWLVKEAWRQVQRANTAEDRARSLSTFRRAIATAQKHLNGEATPELLEWLERLQVAAEELYDATQDEHVRRAVRGLGSLRMAVDARLSAGAGHQPIELVLAGPQGERLTSLTMPAAGPLLATYGVPEEHRDGQATVEIRFDQPAEIKVRKGRRVVFKREAET